MKLTKERFYELAASLERKHALFYQLWELGEPEFTESIPTAAVTFDKEGACIKFLFNPDFWNSLDEDTKLFVIGHECLHVILKHGLRSRKALKSKDPNIMKALNVSMDIVVNTLLTRSFGFKRNDLDERISEDGCWVDTVFKGKTYPDDKHFEFYYKRVRKQLQENRKSSSGGSKEGSGSGKPMPSSIDDHEQMAEIPESLIEEALEDAAKSLSDEEIEEFNEKVEKYKAEDGEKAKNKAGAGGGNTIVKIPKMNVKENRAWENVIDKWIRGKMKMQRREQWARKARRHSLLGEGLFLPSERDVEDKGDKIDVWFFLDTSGSCSRYAKRFFKAVETVPESHFNLRVFCFDTKVYETDMESRKLYGFGGTSFDVIEDKIQDIIEDENIRYPSAVFLVTDGWGNWVRPEFPERWHWFMTDHNTKRYIPKESFVGNLIDYEQ